MLETVLGQLPNGQLPTDNSHQDDSPPGQLNSKTIPHLDNSPLGQLPTIPH